MPKIIPEIGCTVNTMNILNFRACGLKYRVNHANSPSNIIYSDWDEFNIASSAYSGLPRI